MPTSMLYVDSRTCTYLHAYIHVHAPDSCPQGYLPKVPTYMYIYYLHVFISTSIHEYEPTISVIVRLEDISGAGSCFRPLRTSTCTLYLPHAPAATWKSRYDGAGAGGYGWVIQMGPGRCDWRAVEVDMHELD